MYDIVCMWVALASLPLIERFLSSERLFKSSPQAFSTSYMSNNKSFLIITITKQTQNWLLWIQWHFQHTNAMLCLRMNAERQVIHLQSQNSQLLQHDKCEKTEVKRTQTSLTRHCTRHEVRELTEYLLKNIAISCHYLRRTITNLQVFQYDITIQTAVTFSQVFRQFLWQQNTS